MKGWRRTLYFLYWYHPIHPTVPMQAKTPRRMAMMVRNLTNPEVPVSGLTGVLQSVPVHPSVHLLQSALPFQLASHLHVLEPVSHSPCMQCGVHSSASLHNG